MASPSILPLRYQKGGNGSSPNKLTANGRPLSELSPMAIRRNSPSFPQPKGGLIKADSSPAGSSPFNSISVNSPRLFWQGRDPTSPSRENKDPNDSSLSTSPTKRSSIENLKKASRVKNSAMFAKEQQSNYDPARPNILDGRPLVSHQGNSFIGRGSDGLRRSDSFVSPTVAKINTNENKETIPSSTTVEQLSPSKLNISPIKSSLSKRTGANMRYSGFDPESGIWEDEDDQERRLPEGRSLHRHAKSVTFDQAPPQINEYEMTTPVPSSVASGSREGSYESTGDDEDDLSFERGSSMDHDDSFDASLEDTDKTPVVLPEDWRFMSPDTANTDLVQDDEDVFNDDLGSPEPDAQPGRISYRPHQTSVNSVDSNGQPRPLPPLPAALISGSRGSETRDSLSGAIERMSSGQRALPSPPPAATISKSDLRRMSAGSLSIEDRLRLMLAKEQDQQKTEVEIQRERRMRRAGSRDLSTAREEYLHQEEANQPQHLEETMTNNAAAPRLSRLSISQQLRSANSHDEMNDYHSESLHGSSVLYDPDVPIPSLEDPTQHHEDEIEIKEEYDDEADAVSLSSIPSYYGQANEDDYNRGDDETSEYSQHSTVPQSFSSKFDEGHETPRAQTPVQELEEKLPIPERALLPDFSEFGDSNNFNLGLHAYMTPPGLMDKDKPLPPPPGAVVDLPDLAALRETIQRPFTPEEQLEPPKLSFSGDDSSADPGTPSSVIRHPVSISPEPGILETNSIGEDAQFSRGASNSKSRSVSAMSEHEEENVPVQEPRLLDPINLTISSEKRISSLVKLELNTESNDDGLGLGLEQAFDRVVEAQKVEFELSLRRLYHPFHGRFPSNEIPASKDLTSSFYHKSAPTLSSPFGNSASVDLLRPLSPFKPHSENLVANRNHNQQRGYLMRHNTKIVVASERSAYEEPHQSIIPEQTAKPGTTSQPNEVQTSTRKASQPTWVAEPWNSKPRRKSIKLGGEKAIAKRKPVAGPVPPLPGLASNVDDGLGAVAEDELAEEEAEEFEDGVERGRLFVKVVGVKDLHLPFPQNERTYFALTLDNGLHCVTTAWLDLAKSAPIGQEFELVVLNDLEFQLTLQMKLEEPKVERPVSPVKPAASPKKQGAFGRFFGSPKKKKESEARASEIQVKRPVTPPSAYELVQGLVAKDGSFARAYVSLNEHEKHAYGRPYTVDVKCFNEWAMEQVSVGSSRSKKGVVELQRRPPYEIGKLELQLLYVPKPKGAKDEDMPKSMNGAIRALREADEKLRQQASIKEFEGYLSQQGGDCPFWRRRFFKLVGTKLTAYHETTLQPRATINLAKASRLINDKTTLTQKETSTKGGGRRKSGFAEEEDGYMFVEEGFRIRFANGEVIDFYADSKASKDEWMVALAQVVGKGISSTSSGNSKSWTEMVLKREKKAGGDAQARKSRPEDHMRPAQPQGLSSPSGIPISMSKAMPALPRPSGHARSESYQGTDFGSRSTANSPVKTKMTSEERRLKARSMAF